jgi:hypothetical protein
MTQPRAIILALSLNQHHHYAPLLGAEDWDLRETADWRPELVQEVAPDLLITPTGDFFRAAYCIREAQRLGIPTLYLQDGILEWRHQWENPRFGDGGRFPYNQPVITDKIACLGWLSARTMEAWGNLGKCEIVGAPRFDPYLTQPVSRLRHDGPKRLLVMTANTPGFTPEQTARVEQSVRDVRDCLAAHAEWQPIWRVRGGLDKKLGLKDNFSHLNGQPLRLVLAEADAALSTPSTVLLETMLCGLPTAVLDYTNSPPYVPTAWSITAPEHVPQVLADLLRPGARRLAFQDEALHNALECRTPATPRMVWLINEMVRLGREARAAGRPLALPPRILPLELGGVALPSDHFNPAQLYPQHPVLGNQDVTTLQSELIHARQEIDLLRHQLQEKTLGFYLRLGMKKIRHLLAG